MKTWRAMPTVDEFRLKKIGRIPMSYFKHRYLQSLNNKFLRSTEWFRTPILVAKTDAVDYPIRDPIPTTSQGRKTTVTIAFTTNHKGTAHSPKRQITRWRMCTLGWVRVRCFWAQVVSFFWLSGFTRKKSQQLVADFSWCYL